jgi:hypothetical protein
MKWQHRRKKETCEDNVTMVSTEVREVDEISSKSSIMAAYIISGSADGVPQVIVADFYFSYR